MSLFSAMRSGVSGMSAQSSRMAAISDNISNSATIGYKRAAVDFSTLMTSSGSTTNYAAGGVRSNVHYQVLKDGTVQGTQSATDMAIEGRGFFVVADNAGNTGTTSGYALTRAGSFLPDDQGFLRNSAGQYLQAWKLGPDGSLPAVNRSSFDGLSAVSIAARTSRRPCCCKRASSMRLSSAGAATGGNKPATCCPSFRAASRSAVFTPCLRSFCRQAFCSCAIRT